MGLLILQNRMMTTVQRRALSTLPYTNVYIACLCVFFYF